MQESIDKIENSTPCKTVKTPENFSSKLSTRDYVMSESATIVQISAKALSRGFSTIT